MLSRLSSFVNTFDARVVNEARVSRCNSMSCNGNQACSSDICFVRNKLPFGLKILRRILFCGLANLFVRQVSVKRRDDLNAKNTN